MAQEDLATHRQAINQAGPSFPLNCPGPQESYDPISLSILTNSCSTGTVYYGIMTIIYCVQGLQQTKYSSEQLNISDTWRPSAKRSVGPVHYKFDQVIQYPHPHPGSADRNSFAPFNSMPANNLLHQSRLYSEGSKSAGQSGNNYNRTSVNQIKGLANCSAVVVSIYRLGRYS